MSDDAAKNKWLQNTNKYITHLQTTNNEENYGKDDESVSSDSDVSVASVRSVRSVRSSAKIGWSGLKLFHTKSKIEISKGAHCDGVILFDNGSTRNILGKTYLLTI